MRRTNLMWMLFLLGVFIFISGFAPSLAEERKVEKKFKVSARGLLTLDSDKGSVDIRTQAAAEVEIVVVLEARTGSRSQAEDWFNNFDLSFDHIGSNVTVNGKWHDPSFRHDNRLGVHYDIRIPKDYNVDVKTAGGSIALDDLAGKAELRTSGGSINMGEIGGPVVAATSGGSISLQGAKGHADLNTSGGSIVVGKIDGPLEAKTSGGSISVEGVNGDLDAKTSGGSLKLSDLNGNVEAKTSGGSIWAELLKQINKPVELKTSGGGITLVIPPGMKADLDASTSGGRVRTDVPLTLQGRISKSSVQGKINGGGELITLKTSGGNIEIKER